MNHDDAWHLLPWFVNGSLRREVQADIDAHLAACADCRSEVALQMKVRDSLAREDGRQASTQSSFDQLWARIEAHGGAAVDEDAAAADLPFPAAAVPSKLRKRRAAGMPRWLVAAVIVQAIGLGVLGWITVNDPSRTAANYQTLSSPAPLAERGQIRAVFAPDLQLQELQALLALSGLTIVAGPTEAGVYTLAPTNAQASDQANVDGALADLRRNASVRFAEPIGDRRPAKP